MDKTNSVNKNEELQPKEIERFFEALQLSTAADRQRFLQFDRFSEGADSRQDRGTETPRVILRDGTTPMPDLK